MANSWPDITPKGFQVSSNIQVFSIVVRAQDNGLFEVALDQSKFPFLLACGFCVVLCSANHTSLPAILVKTGSKCYKRVRVQSCFGLTSACETSTAGPNNPSREHWCHAQKKTQMKFLSLELLELSWTCTCQNCSETMFLPVVLVMVNLCLCIPGCVTTATPREPSILWVSVGWPSCFGCTPVQSKTRKKWHF